MTLTTRRLSPCLRRRLEEEAKRRGLILPAQRKNLEAAAARSGDGLAPGLIDFTLVTFPQYRPAPHHDRIAEALEAVAQGQVRRLMIFLPPRHGKSELVSIRFPAWFLGRFPDRRIIHASYSALLSNRFSRAARNLLTSREYQGIFPGILPASDSRAVDEWDIAGRRGGLTSAGVGGSITGKGAHVAIIDDPVKGAQEAYSETVREGVKEWYQRDLRTRLEENGSIVICQTRWHEDDLSGWLLSVAAGGGESWEVLSLPAIDETGAALWPQKYPLPELESIRAAVGETAWSALYQQRPTPPGGAFFKTANLQIIDAAPAGLRRVRAWDSAATAAGGDYTAGVLLGADPEGRFFVLDVIRGQWGTDERDAVVKQTAALDGRSVSIRGPQDPGGAGKSEALRFSRLLAGYTVRTERVTGEKTTRAAGFASQVNAGNVSLVKGDWNRAYLEELRAFPVGAHDDQVDASADAFNELTGDEELPPMQVGRYV